MAGVFPGAAKGAASRVAPIDKLSLALTITLPARVLGESLTWQLVVGAALIVAGALVTLL